MPEWHFIRISYHTRYTYCHFTGSIIAVEVIIQLCPQKRREMPVVTRVLCIFVGLASTVMYYRWWRSMVFILDDFRHGHDSCQRLEFGYYSIILPRLTFKKFQKHLCKYFHANSSGWVCFNSIERTLGKLFGKILKWLLAMMLLLVAHTLSSYILRA